jgi:dimethylhistidine N-methyltransferase
MPAPAATPHAIDALAAFAADVRAGLTRPGQKELHSKYFYDQVGSALFEVISVLPEYGVTRAGERLLRENAPDLARRLPLPVVVAELGSGSGVKTRWVLEALTTRQERMTFYPIDISPTALAICERELADIESLEITSVEATYLEGLDLVAERRNDGDQMLVLFLGGNIGNFERPKAEEFLRQVRRCLRPGDGLLVATDLEKPATQLIAAYDDPIGVTASFNRNLLARINRELDADFALSQFRHLALYNKEEQRIEMHLESTVDQTVTIRKADLTVSFRKGETIWTESSHRYREEELPEIAERTGFYCEVQWVDHEWPFAQSLFVADEGE